MFFLIQKWANFPGIIGSLITMKSLRNKNKKTEIIRISVAFILDLQLIRILFVFILDLQLNYF